ncbi:ribonuclease E/G [uncultured Veillonella sp.]|uniref:ribonuclease E/G n=1 Tax=uncultured Veillonella sp. TaxID=159268 RepID=UPI00261CA6D5|nr:ribonuclease E/G [uncultured Veillonella sp.]
MKRIIANVMPEETRLVVVDETNELVDIAFHRQSEDELINHIFKGTVRNVLPGMAAAFVDIGGKQNAYLNLKQGKQTKSMGKLFVGQHILVQVVKEEMLGKGARVSADISLAGRFMVLLPYSEGLHISKRITDSKQRDVLTTMAEPYLASGCGLILRTAAAKAAPEDLKADIEYLWNTWIQLQNRFKVAKGGTELYGDADFWFRVLRDYGATDVKEIIVDDEMAYERLRELLALTKLDARIELVHYEARTPIFKAWPIEEQLEELTTNRVALPSGGYLQIDSTEALTVIDVNSAHFTGAPEVANGAAGDLAVANSTKKNSATTLRASEVAVAVNKEAVQMIAKQIRLRDIGGIIICDFIDMPKKAQRDALLDELTRLTRTDRVKTVVCGITSLGLVELTRKRERKGIQSLLFDDCAACGGTGLLLSSETVYLQILRRLRELYRLGRLKTDVQVDVHPEVARYFTKQGLQDLSKELKRTIKVSADSTGSREAYSLLALDESTSR